MKIFYLKRIAENKDGTFGVLFNDTVPFALTVERKWINNKPNESCIPVGEYTCKRVVSPKFGETFEVKNVIGRTSILFHKGNIDDDSHGCIIVAEKFEYQNGEVRLSESKQGFLEFIGMLADEDQFTLVIKNVS